MRHTKQQSQECLLNIAEIRREIVVALNLHIATNGLAAKPPPNPNLKPTRVHTRNSLSSKHSTTVKKSAGNNNTRCNSYMSKVMSSNYTQIPYNEVKSITICGNYSILGSRYIAFLVANSRRYNKDGRYQKKVICTKIYKKHVA